MKQVLIGLIKFYKSAVSPYLPDACRFSPTCSEYAVLAITRHGALKGGLLATWRILRCNPFCKGGFDPVPETFGRPVSLSHLKAPRVMHTVLEEK